jgi:hypothetical protein
VSVEFVLIYRPHPVYFLHGPWIRDLNPIFGRPTDERFACVLHTFPYRDIEKKNEIMRSEKKVKHVIGNPCR